jgi:urease subunit gamma/beta
VTASFRIRPNREPGNAKAARAIRQDRISVGLQDYDSAVRLTDWEQQRLTIFTAAELARRHRATGLKLNAPEAIALMCDAMFEAARAGASYEEVEAAGSGAVAVGDVMDGVPALVDEVRLEVLMGDGTRLVVLRHPLGAPETTGGTDRTDLPDRPARPTITLTVTNTSDHIVRVSSHYPFDQVNSRLQFDRAAAHGYRLDLPAGSTLRWGPGETRDVALVKYGGQGS